MHKAAWLNLFTVYFSRVCNYFIIEHGFEKQRQYYDIQNSVNLK